MEARIAVVTGKTPQEATINAQKHLDGRRPSIRHDVPVQMSAYTEVKGGRTV
jgi:hypothetical protein